ncbi:MAG: class I SAM-dependent methyltransferase [Candidatus Entotheonellia bacterium]
MSNLGVVNTLQRVCETLTQQALRIAPGRLYSEYTNRRFDRIYGVKTGGLVEAQDLDVPVHIRRHVTRYQASKIKVLRHILRQIPTTYNEFTFIDFGCGKGRALLIATAHGFKRIIGIEISPNLHKIGQENIQKYRTKTGMGSNIELHCMNVTEFALPAEPALFYFYNPFDQEITATVLKNIEQSLTEKPREIFLVYVFPRCIDLLEAAQFLQLERQGKMCGDHYRIYKSHRSSQQPSSHSAASAEAAAS